MQGMDVQKKYYRINEVAEMLRLPASTLRYWEQEFSTIKPKRSKSGRRYYTVDDIEKISIVNYLIKERGLKIEAAKEYLRTNPEGIDQRHRTVMRLKTIRATLQELLDTLHYLR